jgi:hypothetical protein
MQAVDAIDYDTEDISTSQGKQLLSAQRRIVEKCDRTKP